jgi:hypothetical protein
LGKCPRLRGKSLVPLPPARIRVFMQGISFIKVMESLSFISVVPLSRVYFTKKGWGGLVSLIAGRVHGDTINRSQER